MPLEEHRTWLLRSQNRWLRGPQLGKITTSPLLSRGPQHSPQRLNQKWLGSPHVGKIATSPLLSRGSATLIAGSKSQMAR